MWYSHNSGDPVDGDEAGEWRPVDVQLGYGFLP